MTSVSVDEVLRLLNNYIAFVDSCEMVVFSFGEVIHSPRMPPERAHEVNNFVGQLITAMNSLAKELREAMNTVPGARRKLKDEFVELFPDVEQVCTCYRCRTEGGPHPRRIPRPM